MRLPVDGRGFVARHCPHCLKQFRTRPSVQDGGALHRALMASAPHENADLKIGKVARCPYCAHSGPPEAFLTRAQTDWLERLAHGFSSHVQFEQMSVVTRSLQENPHPTFVPVRPKALPLTLSEADDPGLQDLSFPCCGATVRVFRTGKATLFCPECGARLSGNGSPEPAASKRC